MSDGGAEPTAYHAEYTAMTNERKSTPRESIRRSVGRSLRQKLKRVDHGKFDVRARKFDPVELMNSAHQQRLTELIPLKNARMAATPFTFFRGSAPLMAADLSAQPRTGINVQICGDAHVQNLGAFGGGTDGHLIFDINDFDETIRAPWEWDVKRMAASLVLAGRESRNSERQCKDAARAFGRKYREKMRQFSELPVLELARYLVLRELQVSPVRAVLRKAERSTPQDSLHKLAERKGAKYQYQELDSTRHSDPPYSTAWTQRLPRRCWRHCRATWTRCSRSDGTSSPNTRPQMSGFRIVGTGSVGTRDYVVLMFGGAIEDPLFLQLKQELPSAYAPYLPRKGVPQHHGQRVAEGVRRMLVQADIFMGWATIEGRPYLVRQLRDHKAGIECSDLEGKGLLQYAEVCGELLAKGHARSGDPCMLAGYLGNSERFDQALVDFAVDYADQATRDFEAWLKGIREGKVNVVNCYGNRKEEGSEGEIRRTAFVFVVPYRLFVGGDLLFDFVTISAGESRAVRDSLLCVTIIICHSASVHREGNSAQSCPAHPRETPPPHPA